MKPIFGIVRNPTDLLIYCGWFVIGVDWHHTPLTGRRVWVQWGVA